MWGVISLGLFANGTYGEGFNGVDGPVKGLFVNGDAGQLVAECIGVVVNFAYVGSVTFVAFKIIGKFVGNRVHPSDELSGLDVPEMGVSGYTAEPEQAIPEARSARLSPPSLRRPMSGVMR
jgi:Amt family ammonium transporter